MALRFTLCCAGAVSLHAALFALGARPVLRSPPSAARTAETEVEWLAPELEPARASPPAAVAELPRRPSPDLPPRVAARARQARSETTVSSAGAAASEDGPEAEPDVAAADPAAKKRLSLADLRIGSSGATLLEGALDGPQRTTPDVGGLRQGRMARDTELGLGPGGAVASAVRASARELAPLGSEATFSVDLSAEGSIIAISLDGVTSDDIAWNALLRALRERLTALSVRVGRPTRVTLLVTNRSTLRAGNASGSPFQFDLSNIGSPTIQSLRVRVLAQTPL